MNEMLKIKISRFTLRYDPTNKARKVSNKSTINLDDL